MNIVIDPHPVAKANLDVARFAALYKPAFDLQAAVNGSVQIVESRVDPTEILGFIYNGLDWSDFFQLWKWLPPVVEIRVHSVLLQGLTVHKPGVINPQTHMLTTEDHVIDQTSLMVVHTGNPRLDKHIEYLMAHTLIEYGEYRWDVLFDLTRSSTNGPVRR